MKNIRKTTSLVLAIALIAAIFAACGNGNGTVEQVADEPAPAATTEKTAAAPEPTPPTSISGSVTTAGSTSVQPLSDELGFAFEEINPDVKVDIQGGGSGQGVKAVEEDLVDFGALSRELKDEERAIIKAEYVIAKDGIAIVVNKGVGVDDLTMEDLKGIFTGEITDWSAVGGSAGKIEVIAREEGSGTRDAFNELTGVLGKDADGNNVDNTVETALIQGSTGAIVSTVSTTESSIGYISLGSLNDSVKAVKVEGVSPSPATVLDGTYKVSRPFIYITGRDLSEAAQAYIDFVLGPEGQAIVEDMGFIPIG